MKRIIIFLIFISSCTNYDKGRIEFFERSPNKNTEFLNEYLWSFLNNTETYHSSKKIHLYDSLFILKNTDRINEILKSNDYYDFNEALISLLAKQKCGIEINFSQLTILEEYRVYAGSIERTNNNHWNYYLSVPGVNKDSTKLVFYYQYHCGGDCGSVRIAFMSKENGKWVLVDEDRISDI